MTAKIKKMEILFCRVGVLISIFFSFWEVTEDGVGEGVDIIRDTTVCLIAENCSGTKNHSETGISCVFDTFNKAW